MKVLALKDHEYDGQKRSAGDVYEAEEKYVPLMRAMGNISPSPEEEEPDSGSSSPKRRYKRRDMVPEA